MDPFRPLPLLGNPHLQTLLANGVSLAREPASTTRLVELPDGDRLAVEVSTPVGWVDGPTVAMVHGLCGSHRSTYMVRMAAKLVAAGLRVARINLRGKGSGQGLARRPYHAGCSEDLRAALLALGGAPPWLIGFSLGGNVSLKLAGELGPSGPGLLAGVGAVCPPVDLFASWRWLTRPEGRRWERMFVGWLLEEMRLRCARWGDPLPALPRRPGVFDIDDRYIAPSAGFAGALAYYAGASALPLLQRIEVPCRLLIAEDDPIVEAAWLTQATLPRDVQVVRTARGGHLGFLGSPGPRFMDEVVLGWVQCRARDRRVTRA